MAVLNVIQVSAINVVLNPHPDGVYERLIRSAYRRKKLGHVYGDRFGLMSQLYPEKVDDEVSGFHGVISTFTKIDPSLPWFNAATADQASEDDLEAINLPDHLLPNHRKCEFYFDLKSHTFVFDSLTRKGGLTAKQMLSFLSNFFHQTEVASVYGVAVLTIIPDEKSVDEVVDWNRIRTLRIHANRPNPDYDEDDLREFSESLADQNAKTLDLTLTAQDNAYLEPSDRTQVVAAIAADNGYVEAKGEDANGQIEIRSTKDKKPLVERDTFDPETESAWDAFRRISGDVLVSIVRRRRKVRRARN